MAREALLVEEREQRVGRERLLGIALSCRVSARVVSAISVIEVRCVVPSMSISLYSTMLNEGVSRIERRTGVGGCAVAPGAQSASAISISVTCIEVILARSCLTMPSTIFCSLPTSRQSGESQRKNRWLVSVFL